MSTFRSPIVGIRVAGIVGLLFHIAIAAAQTASWTAPTDGYVFDYPSRSIRSVDGFIGSAVLGPEVLDGLEWASVAPNRKSALVRRTGIFLWIPDLNSPGQSQQLSGLPQAEKAIWASDSSRVVILGANNNLYWLNNLISTPNLEAKWSLGVAAGRRLNRDSLTWSLLAADALADRVLVARGDGAVGQLRTASVSSAPMAVPFSGNPVAAAFLPGGTSAFVADGATSQVVRIQALDTVPVSGTFLASGVPVNQPSGMAISGDGKRLFVVDSVADTVRIFDSATSAPMTGLPTDTVPASLTPFGLDRFILYPVLSGDTGVLTSQPLVLLDTSVEPKVLFIPRGK